MCQHFYILADSPEDFSIQYFAFPDLRHRFYLFRHLQRYHKFQFYGFLKNSFDGLWPFVWFQILNSAEKLASLTGLAINVHYGMLRQGLPSELSLLLQQGRDAQSKALKAAMKKRLIATLSSEELDAVLDRLEEI